MTQRHCNEILRAEEMRVTSDPVEIRVTGLVQSNSEKLNKSLSTRFKALEREILFFLQSVPNLYTSDDNRQLGTHYLEYRSGPHNVPYRTFESSTLRRFL